MFLRGTTDGRGSYTPISGDCARRARTATKDSQATSNGDPDSDLSQWRFTDSSIFQKTIGLVIVANTCCIALEAAYIQHQELEVSFGRAEVVFTFVYVAEISWRLRDNGCLGFFTSRDVLWNVFDVLVTTIGVGDMIMRHAGKGYSTGAEVGRFFRIFRILRMFRALRFLSDFDYVVITSAKATLHLSLLVTFVCFTFAILATQLMHNSHDDRVVEMFGDLPSSGWSLFKMMTLDGWVRIAELVITERPAMIVFFIVFVFFSSIAIMSLVPAIFIELHMKTKEAEQKQTQELESATIRRKHTRVLKRLFKLTDEDRSGAVSVSEVEKALGKASVLQQLTQAGLLGDGDLRDVKLGLDDLFQDDRDIRGTSDDLELSQHDFVEGFLRVKDASNTHLWRSIASQRTQLRDLGDASSFELQTTQEVASKALNSTNLCDLSCKLLARCQETAVNAGRILSSGSRDFESNIGEELAEEQAALAEVELALSKAQSDLRSAQDEAAERARGAAEASRRWSARQMDAERALSSAKVDVECARMSVCDMECRVTETLDYRGERLPFGEEAPECASPEVTSKHTIPCNIEDYPKLANMVAAAVARAEQARASAIEAADVSRSRTSEAIAREAATELRATSLAQELQAARAATLKAHMEAARVCTHA